MESKYVDKLNEIKKQLDTRWKQIDKFESSVKTYADVKAGWRRKYAVKEGEMEGLKVIFSLSFPPSFVLMTFLIIFENRQQTPTSNPNYPTSNV